MHVPRKLAALAVLSTLSVPIAIAGAQDPAPTPCNGVLISDAAGDQKVAPLFGGTPMISTTGPDNLDIRAVFFNMTPGPDGKPVLTANMQIQNLTPEVPAEAREGFVRYQVDFGPLGDVEHLTAILDADGWSFVYGKITDVPDPLGHIQYEEVETKGKAFEGKDGVIQIEMPASAGVKDGTEMKDVIARVVIGKFSTLYSSDSAPDAAADAVDFVVRDCPPLETGSGDDGGTNGTNGSNGSNGSNGQAGAPGQAGGPAPTPGQPGPGLLPVAGPLKVSVAVDKGKRKTARKRGLRARVRCSVQCRATAVAKVNKRTARKLRLVKKGSKKARKKFVTLGRGKGTILKPGRQVFFIKMTKKTKKAFARKGVKKFKLNVVFRVTDLNGKQVKKATKRSTLR